MRRDSVANSPTCQEQIDEGALRDADGKLAIRDRDDAGNPPQWNHSCHFSSAVGPIPFPPYSPMTATIASDAIRARA